jgi:hypothetical protein
VPFHHDEGVNGDFLRQLFRQGHYVYEPTNYHGPTLYYFALVSAYLNTFLFGVGGLNDSSMRLVQALFGIAVIWLVLCLRRNLGAWAAFVRGGAAGSVAGHGLHFALLHPRDAVRVLHAGGCGGDVTFSSTARVVVASVGGSGACCFAGQSAGSELTATGSSTGTQWFWHLVLPFLVMLAASGVALFCSARSW